jgi:hypothetical protein
MTMSYKDAPRELKNTKDIWEDLYTTEAMTNRKWTETDYKLRHVINRIAVHGFHFKFCSEASFHETSDECRCKLCSGPCERDHMTQCAVRTTYGITASLMHNVRNSNLWSLWAENEVYCQNSFRMSKTRSAIYGRRAELTYQTPKGEPTLHPCSDP